MKNVEKVFTKKLEKGIMKKNYNPLYKTKNYYKGDGLLMTNKIKESILVILKEENVDEEVLQCCYNICKYYNSRQGV